MDHTVVMPAFPS